jgi:hypothetical protein
MNALPPLRPQPAEESIESLIDSAIPLVVPFPEGEEGSFSKLLEQADERESFLGADSLFTEAPLDEADAEEAVLIGGWVPFQNEYAKAPEKEPFFGIESPMQAPLVKEPVGHSEPLILAQESPKTLQEPVFLATEKLLEVIVPQTSLPHQAESILEFEPITGRLEAPMFHDFEEEGFSMQLERASEKDFEAAEATFSSTKAENLPQALEGAMAQAIPIQAQAPSKPIAPERTQKAERPIESIQSSAPIAPSAPQGEWSGLGQEEMPFSEQHLPEQEQVDHTPIAAPATKGNDFVMDALAPSPATAPSAGFETLPKATMAYDLKPALMQHLSYLEANKPAALSVKLKLTEDAPQGVQMQVKLTSTGKLQVNFESLPQEMEAFLKYTWTALRPTVDEKGWSLDGPHFSGVAEKSSGSPSIATEIKNFLKSFTQGPLARMAAPKPFAKLRNDRRSPLNLDFNS